MIRVTDETGEARPRGDRKRFLRVLWLIKGLGAGGAELLLRSMAEVRDRDRFDVAAAYLLPWKDTLADDLRSMGVPVVCLNGGMELDPRWALRLRHLVIRESIDVVHIHSPYVAGVARPVLRTMAARPKLVTTEHVPWPIYATPTRMLNSFTFGMDDAHIAVSNAVRESIPPRLRTNVDVIVHGIPVERVAANLEHRDAARHELGIRPDEVVVGTVSNFRAQKDYPNLLKAAQKALAANPSLRFVAIGQGPLEGEIRALHRAMGLGDKFTLTGYRPDAARLMAGFDIFTLASLDEGLPVALMEAMALGLPTVATGVGGVPECVGAGIEGILVPPSDPDELGAALSTMAGDPAMRLRMGKAARDRGMAFDVREAMKKIESVYVEVTR